MNIPHGTPVPKLFFDSMQRKCVMQNYENVVVYPWPFSLGDIVALSNGCGGQPDDCDEGICPVGVLFSISSALLSGKL